MPRGKQYQASQPSVPVRRRQGSRKGLHRAERASEVQAEGPGPHLPEGEEDTLMVALAMRLRGQLEVFLGRHVASALEVQGQALQPRAPLWLPVCETLGGSVVAAGLHATMRTTLATPHVALRRECHVDAHALSGPHGDALLLDAEQRPRRGIQARARSRGAPVLAIGAACGSELPRARRLIALQPERGAECNWRLALPGDEDVEGLPVLPADRTALPRDKHRLAILAHQHMLGAVLGSHNGHLPEVVAALGRLEAGRELAGDALLHGVGHVEGEPVSVLDRLLAPPQALQGEPCEVIGQDAHGAARSLTH
mmetsp:Transcript_36151/g.104017  ORF Transcript_36151/g.104017 Transcript_36151/m.104017 type:complete len:311 (-) Transcript_36151:15-947(-)